jgi:hypothetical protein
MDPFALILLIGIVAAGVLSIRQSRGAERRGEVYRRNMERDFRQLVMHAPDPRFSFDGGRAEVVTETRQYENDDMGSPVIRVQRFARNDYGEYFYVVLNGDASAPSFIKHVPHERAKIALGKRYLPPSQAQC